MTGVELNCSDTIFHGQVIAGLDPGNTYLLQLWSDQGSGSTFEFCLKEGPPAPANDLCVNAQLLACGDVIRDSTDFASDVDAPDLVCSPSDGTIGLWYVLQGNGDSITLSTVSAFTSLNTKIHVFRGDCDDLQCVASADGSPSGVGPTEVRFLSQPDSMYYIYVDAFGSTARGRYELFVSCQQNCPDNLFIPGMPVSQLFRADTIGSDAKILDPQNVHYRAVSEISLEPMFEVGPNALFEASIGDCPEPPQTRVRSVRLESTLMDQREEREKRER